MYTFKIPIKGLDLKPVRHKKTQCYITLKDFFNFIQTRKIMAKLVKKGQGQRNRRVKEKFFDTTILEQSKSLI